MVSASGFFCLGYNSGDNGIYNLSSGSLYGGFAELHRQQWQRPVPATGHELHAQRCANIGISPGGSGTYSLGGSGVLFSLYDGIGISGTRALRGKMDGAEFGFRQTGSGQNGEGSGTYNLSSSGLLWE